MKQNNWYYRLLLLSLTAALLGGCAPGRITHILRNDLPVTGEGESAVMLIQEGISTPAKVQTNLNKGDEVLTLPGVTAIVWLKGGSQLILAPETHIQLVNPNHIINLLKSTGEVIGRVFVKARDSLRIDTEYASASTEGTEFQVSRGPDDTFTVAVISGVVRMVSKTGRFAAVRLSRLEQATVSPGAAPQKSVLSPEQANEIIHWVNKVEQKIGAKDLFILLPDVTGLPLELAQQKLRNANIAIGSVVASIEGNQAIGTIISQQPEVGARIGRNQGVNLVYRAEERVVPVLAGLRQDAAIQRIRDLGLVTGTITTEITGGSEAGKVIRQDPQPSQRVATGSAVSLVIEAESVVVPPVTGKMLQDVRYILSNERLGLGQVNEQMTGNYPAGTVIGQSPAGMTRVPPGTAIALTVEVDSVEVPLLTGRMLQDAQYMLANARLGLGQVNEEMTGNYPVGTVIRQNPEQMRRVAPGTAVALTVEAESVVVPQLQNYQVNQAYQLLSQRGLRAGPQNQQLAANVASGTVIGQYPPPGQRVRKNSEVSLTIAEAGILVPPLTGMAYSRALVILRNAGLSTGNPTRQVRTDMQPDTVISQSPSANSLVRRGSNVQLEISQRPIVPQFPPAPLPRIPTQPTNISCIVPNIIGQEENAAVAMIRNARLTPQARYHYEGSRVTRQNPAGNSTAVCGSTVTYDVGTIQ